MNDIIHLLPDSVANQIAAGEVVQRPASIVKEMVENAIDAGAQHIQVFVTDGGKTNVQVIDDGKGMSESDARMSFERHATSKIQKASDLFTLSTMGFRGEALASIAAVAQVELKTRRPDDELGTYIQISGSRIESQEPVACPVGSNFSVKNLFYNVPARRKFLKANQTELSNIVADFERIALVYPQLSFSLHSGDSEMYNLQPGSLRTRILAVFGKRLNAELLPVEVETSLVKITGYVAKPESAKKKGTHQYFFVNGRFMRHPYFHSAVMRAYDGLIPAGEHISYFIYFSVDPSAIDVNVHPTKTEIKFDNEQAIWQVLSAAVRETVGRFSGVPMIDFDVEGKPDIPAMGAPSSHPAYQPRPVKTSYNPFAAAATTARKAPADWQELYPSKSLADTLPTPSAVRDQTSNSLQPGTSYPDLQDDLIPSGLDVEASSALPLWGEEEEVHSKVFDSDVPQFQYRGRYIVSPSTDGLILIDQHRAHVRILYERNMSALTDRPRPSQKILFPEIVQFSLNEAAILDAAIDDFLHLGFELTSLGGGSYSVSAVPGGIEGLNTENLLHEMVDAIRENPQAPRQDARHSVALSLANASAIVYGQVLSELEMHQLLHDLFLTSAPARTPDGKLIYTVLDPKTIDKLFN